MKTLQFSELKKKPHKVGQVAANKNQAYHTVVQLEVAVTHYEKLCSVPRSLKWRESPINWVTHSLLQPASECCSLDPLPDTFRLHR